MTTTTSTLTSRRRLLALDRGVAEPAPLGEPPPSMAVLALNRMGFGPRPGDIAAFNALGANDGARLAAYVAQQLFPGADVDDTEYWNRRNGLAGHPNPGFTTLGMTLQQLWQTYRTGGGSPSSRPVQEVRLDTLLRMAYSRWQLREAMVDFWMNHFNVYGFESYTQETFVHWNRDVIRAHAFGNFRSMLEAVARSTTMLYYLDNYTNTRSGPNENWARELFELHTLGAENYLGVGDPTAVPAGDPWPAGSPWPGQPAPEGYVDNDVYEAARCFTGWGVDGTTGLFSYTDANHDRFSKSVLHFGVLNVPADQGPEIDGETVLDLLAHHPGTARHLARKLCRRFVADDPPPTLVDAAAQAFLDNVGSSSQIRTVVATILNSPEFKESWGGKVKRPLEWTVSALRATNAAWLFGFTSQNPLTTESDTSNLISRQTRTGQGGLGGLEHPRPVLAARRLAARSARREPAGGAVPVRPGRHHPGEPAGRPALLEPDRRLLARAHPRPDDRPRGPRRDRRHARGRRQPERPARPRRLERRLAPALDRRPDPDDPRLLPEVNASRAETRR